jgi:hypothetical protein
MPTAYNVATFAMDISMLSFLKKTILPEEKRRPVNSLSANVLPGIH